MFDKPLLPASDSKVGKVSDTMQIGRIERENAVQSQETARTP